MRRRTLLPLQKIERRNAVGASRPEEGAVCTLVCDFHLELVRHHSVLASQNANFESAPSCVRPRQPLPEFVPTGGLMPDIPPRRSRRTSTSRLSGCRVTIPLNLSPDAG
jgi:hypothetical protein